MSRGDATTSCHDETMRGQRKKMQHNGGLMLTNALQILRQGYGTSTLQRRCIGMGIGRASTAFATGGGGGEGGAVVEAMQQPAGTTR